MTSQMFAIAEKRLAKAKKARSPGASLAAASAGFFFSSEAGTPWACKLLPDFIGKFKRFSFNRFENLDSNFKRKTYFIYPTTVVNSLKGLNY